MLSAPQLRENDSDSGTAPQPQSSINHFSPIINHG
jgi:hypothetical protein